MLWLRSALSADARQQSSNPAAGVVGGARRHQSRCTCSACSRRDQQGATAFEMCIGDATRSLLQEKEAALQEAGHSRAQPHSRPESGCAPVNLQPAATDSCNSRQLPASLLHPADAHPDTARVFCVPASAESPSPRNSLLTSAVCPTCHASRRQPTQSERLAGAMPQEQAAWAVAWPKLSGLNPREHVHRLHMQCWR